MKQKITRTILVAGIAALFTAGCGSKETPDTSDDKTLYFSAIPDQKSVELNQKFGNIAEYLSAELGVPVEYKPSKDYKASVEEFKNGNILLAWFGGVTGVQAMKVVPGSRAIAQGKADPEFYSYFIAHKDLGLTKSDSMPDIADKTFAFGSQDSTSGRVMPQYYIEENSGKETLDYFNTPPIFSGSHDNTYELVKSGEIQVGALNYKVFEKKAAADHGEVVVIWKTPTYPDYNMTAHPDLETRYGVGFTDKLQQALLDMDEKDKELLTAFPRDELIAAKNEDFEAIRIVAEKLGFL
jgi:phosphonate transport system substrate-binding protein